MSPIPPFGTQEQPTTSFPSNDRTWFAEQRVAQQQEQRTEDELHAHELMGAGRQRSV